MTHPPVSETAAPDEPTPLDQRYRNAFETVRELVRTGRATTTEALLCGAISGLHAERSDLVAEILRLRAENERLTKERGAYPEVLKQNYGMTVENEELHDLVRALEAELAAATRERETP